VVSEAATRMYQAPLFSFAMVSRADFSPSAVFKLVATMCERGSSTATNAMKTEVHLEAVVDSEENTVQELFAAVARVKTMPARPMIERSSISPGVVVVDNSQGIFQLVGLKGKVFVPRRVLLDSGAQPLMLEASAVEGWSSRRILWRSVYGLLAHLWGERNALHALRRQNCPLNSTRRMWRMQAS
jgi:hypothetical protein